MFERPAGLVNGGYDSFSGAVELADGNLAVLRRNGPAGEEIAIVDPDGRLVWTQDGDTIQYGGQLLGVPQGDSLLTIASDQDEPDSAEAIQYSIDDGSEICRQRRLPSSDEPALHTRVSSDPASDGFVVVSLTQAGGALDIRRYTALGA